MTERPILMSGPMVRALLAGTKTQTRRIVQPTRLDDDGHCDFCGLLPEVDEQHICPPGFLHARCPYGAPGDRLWARETWGLVRPTDPTDWLRGPIKERDPRTFWDVAFRADYGLGQMYREPDADVGFWRPSIHMPRWASRLTLEVTGVRVERLQAISEEDARAEGVERSDYLDPLCEEDEYWECYREGCDCAGVTTARDSFRTLWESINGAESWAANPWVWVVEFKRVTP